MLRFTLEKNIKASNFCIEDSLKKFFINLAGELTKDIEPSEQINVLQVEKSWFFVKLRTLKQVILWWW